MAKMQLEHNLECLVLVVLLEIEVEVVNVEYVWGLFLTSGIRKYPPKKLNWNLNTYKKEFSVSGINELLEVNYVELIAKFAD